MDKKNILVTGCSRGIGLAIAKKLIDEGYFVVGTSRSKIDLANLLGSDNCLHQAVDVSNEDDISSMIESLTKQDIHIHCLVNNAGITKDQLFMRMNSDDWNSVINTNLNGVFYLTKSLIKNLSILVFNSLIKGEKRSVSNKVYLSCSIIAILSNPIPVSMFLLGSSPMT